MDEHFLHYLWKYQKFESGQLSLTEGQRLLVFSPGNHNMDAGPDFEESRIKVDAIEWAGQVEIHLKSSDWYHHNHQTDPAYENVILHVVWEHDKEVTIDGSPIPTLELKGVVDPLLLEKYRLHLNQKEEIICSSQFHNASSISIRGMLDRTLAERLEEKSERILADLKKNKNNWEETTYHLLAANFGFSTNKETFVRLTETLPYQTLKKVLHNRIQAEALLFGQAGFLEEAEDEYQDKLRSEFQFLRKKFKLNDSILKVQWKFGKLRPANFPTVRLAQFASLLNKHPQLFRALIEMENIKALKEELRITVSDYWQTHYDFAKKGSRTLRSMGDSSFNNLLINTLAPLLAAYSKSIANQAHMDRAVALLESIPPETNRFTKKWDKLPISSATAFDSQAIIQLFKNYCQRKRCLQCNVGVELLNK